VQNLTLVSASVLIALVASEAFFRLFPGFLPEEAQLRLHWNEQPDVVSKAHPYTGFLYPPFYRGRGKMRNMDWTYKTDEHGFRNPSPWPQQSEIVAVGDSMTFGYGVDDQQAWTRLLDKELPRSQVINLGLPGTAPQQYLRIYETFGVDLKPKVVLFGLFPGNDMRDASRFDEWLQAGGPGNYDTWRFWEGAPPGDGDGIYSLIKNSRLFFFLRTTWKYLGSNFSAQTFTLPAGNRLSLVPTMYAHDASLAAQPTHPAFSLVLHAIEQTRQLAASTDGQFVVLLFPTKEEVYLPLLDKPTPKLVEAFVTAFKEQGIPFLDLTPHLQEYARAGQKLYFEIDGHPNAQGYQLIAQVVHEHLKNNARRYGLQDWD
jgi:lysophospholipase L1-like esterase